jgi:hypothetical protein
MHSFFLMPRHPFIRIEALKTMILFMIHRQIQTKRRRNYDEFVV